MSITPASAQYFQENASKWDQLRADYFGEPVRAAAIARAYLRPDMTVADIGAGTGFMAAGLAARVHKVHLVDASLPMLDVARQNLAAFSNVEFHHADGLELPFANASLDAVFANMYLHHCPDPLAAIQEMARTLRPGGRLIITDLDAHPHAELKEEMADVWQGFEREQVRTWLAEAGLVNLIVDTTEQSCCAPAGSEPVEISVFAAVGTQRHSMRAAVQDAYSGYAQSGQSCCSALAASAVEETSGQPAAAQPCCSPSAELLQVTTSSSCCGSAVTQEDAASPCCSPSAEPISSSSCCSSAEQPQGSAAYISTDLVSVPAEAAEFSLGCGNPFALQELQPGQVVLDIGSGGGLDAFIAARQVGSGGRVIGVDMTPAMLERATDAAQRAGITNVEFRHGYAESLPVEAESVDVILSNCVINLSEDKGLVFREAYRALKPGGRLQISDIVAAGSLPKEVQNDSLGWSGCISGALPEAEYVGLVAQAGFQEVSRMRSASTQVAGGVPVYSLLLTARKP